jgi:ABC-type antimicrobial peptide transport system permease subunit
MLLEGVIVGMEASMNTMVEGAEVMLRQADIADTSLSSIEERFGDRLAALPGVQSADGIIFTAIAMPDAGSFFIVFGYQPNSYAIRRFDMVEGETLSGNRQVILGRMMADALDKKIGSTIDLSGSRFKVIGIYESKVSWEEMGGVITLRDAQLLAGRPRVVTMYALTLKDPDQAKAMVARLNADYPEVQASLSTEFAEQMPDFERSGQMLNGISALAVLVGGVGVLNTMLMAVFERTREIGVLRSMGWRRRGVLSMILQEALLLGLIGGVSGIGIAIAMTAGLRTIPVWGTIVEPAWEWQVMLRAMLTALILGLVGGLYPAYRATRLQPVEALRYE